MDINLGEKKRSWLTSRTLWLNLLVLAGVIGLLAGVLWLTFPDLASAVFYRGVYLHSFHVLFYVVGAVAGYKGIKMIGAEDRLALGGIYVAVSLIAIFGGSTIIESMGNWRTCQYANFKKIDNIIDVDRHAIRYTPLHVAYKDMVQTISTSAVTVELDRTDAIDLNGRFGYITPISPDGTIVTFLNKNDGFIAYDDGANVAPEQRVHRVKQPFEYGEGMQVWDSLERHLYATDSLAQYPDIHYLQLDPTKPEVITAVAPKVKYKYAFPWNFVPVWGGVVLVQADGKTEELTPSQALADPRLKNRKIFPSTLARKYVETQIYDAGYWKGWFKREGKIQVPDLPGENQMPFFTRASDGRSHYVVAAEPDGQAYALFRLYYIDAYSGERLYYECDPRKGVLGPVSALDRVRNLSGYRWVHGGARDSEGDFRVVEPTYLPKDGLMFWKFTITPRTYTGVTSTVVVNAHSGEIHEHKTSADFYGWFDGKAAAPAAPATIHTPPKPQVEAGGSVRPSTVNEDLDALQRDLEQLTKRLGDLKKRLPAER